MDFDFGPAQQATRQALAQEERQPELPRASRNRRPPRRFQSNDDEPEHQRRRVASPTSSPTRGGRSPSYTQDQSPRTPRRGPSNSRRNTDGASRCATPTLSSEAQPTEEISDLEQADAIVAVTRTEAEGQSTTSSERAVHDAID